MASAVAIAPELIDRPELFRRLIACRMIAENGARLACYDERVAAFDTAERQHEVVVIDRQQVRETRKALFGLSLPDLKLFGAPRHAPIQGKTERHVIADEDVSEIDGVVESATRTSNGRWLLVLSDGARWQQMDDNVVRIPRKGDVIHIRKGMMGGYLANINKQVAIRVHRVN